MITAEQMTKAMFILEASRVITGMQGQAMVWFELIAEAVPQANDDDLMLAVRKIAKSRTSDSRGSWVMVGDLILQLRSIRRTQIEAREWERRRIESGHPSVVSIDVKLLMADASRGLDPEEVGRRARERSEKAIAKEKS